MDPKMIASAVGMNMLNNKLKTDERAQAQRYASYMSNTGYQRAMADMKAGGLNPILAGKYGPASTPNVAQADVGVRTGEYMQQMSSAKQSLASANQLGQQALLTEAQKDEVRFRLDNILPFEQSKLIEEINKLSNEQKNILADTLLKVATTDEKVASAKEKDASTRLKNMETQFKRIETLLLNLDKAGYEALSKKLDIPMGKNVADLALKTIQTAFQGLSNFSASLNFLKSLFGKKPTTTFNIGVNQ